MPCIIMKDEKGKPLGFICLGKKLQRRPCKYCSKPHTKLCDFPISPGITCDAKLCDLHAVPAGKNKDLCPDHKGKVKFK